MTGTQQDTSVKRPLCLLRAGDSGGPASGPASWDAGKNPGKVFLRPPWKRRGGQRARCTHTRCPLWEKEQTLALGSPDICRDFAQGLGLVERGAVVWAGCFPSTCQKKRPPAVDTAPRLGNPHTRGPRTFSPKHSCLREPGAPGLSAKELATC